MHVGFRYLSQKFPKYLFFLFSSFYISFSLFLSMCIGPEQDVERLPWPSLKRWLT